MGQEQSAPPSRSAGRRSGAGPAAPLAAAIVKHLLLTMVAGDRYRARRAGSDEPVTLEAELVGGEWKLVTPDGRTSYDFPGPLTSRGAAEEWVAIQFLHPGLAPKAHVHPELAPKVHVHPELAYRSHVHPELAYRSHVHPELDKRITGLGTQVSNNKVEADRLFASTDNKLATYAKQGHTHDDGIVTNIVGNGSIAAAIASNIGGSIVENGRIADAIAVVIADDVGFIGSIADAIAFAVVKNIGGDGTTGSSSIVDAIVENGRIAGSIANPVNPDPVNPDPVNPDPGDGNGDNITNVEAIVNNIEVGGSIAEAIAGNIVGVGFNGSIADAIAVAVAEAIVNNDDDGGSIAEAIAGNINGGGSIAEAIAGNINGGGSIFDAIAGRFGLNPPPQ